MKRTLLIACVTAAAATGLSLAAAGAAGAQSEQEYFDACTRGGGTVITYQAPMGPNEYYCQGGSVDGKDLGPVPQ